MTNVYLNNCGISLQAPEILLSATLTSISHEDAHVEVTVKPDHIFLQPRLASDPKFRPLIDLFVRSDGFLVLLVTNLPNDQRQIAVLSKTAEADIPF